MKLKADVDKPCRNTLTKIVEVKADKLRSYIMGMFINIQFIALTSDIWTDTINTRSYIPLTTHFIEDYKYKSILISVKHMNVSHTAVNIMNEIERILNEYQIEKQKIVSITTDNGANMVKASVDAFGSERHIPCLAHTLNFIVSYQR